MHFDEVIQRLSEWDIHYLWREAKYEMSRALIGAAEETKEKALTAISETKGKTIRIEMDNAKMWSTNHSTKDQKYILRLVKKMIDEHQFNSHEEIIITDDDIKEEKIEKTVPEETDNDILESIIKNIEVTIKENRHLDLMLCNLQSPEQHFLAKALDHFEDRKDDLAKITSLHIEMKYLNDAKLLFEINGIKKYFIM
ncbi:hypothetical protein LQZ19_18290 [Treponema primitia]|uniref:FliG C-terminal domain-containing protein n=1 Tax=Treponema primitia TaxID=88058 RepID=UPI00397FE7DD